MAFDRSRYRFKPPPATAPGAGGSSSGSSSTNQDEPLGVEAGYTTSVRSMWTPSPGRSGRTGPASYVTSQGPRYFKDDEFGLSNALPPQIVRIQREMWDAGLYDGPIDQVGTWSGNTIKAYKKLLEYANQAGLTADQALIRMKRGAALGGTAGAGAGGEAPGAGDIIGYNPDGTPIFAPGEQFVAPALELQLPNRQELESVVRKSVIEQLGVGWSQENVARTADGIMAEYRRLQTDAYDQQVENLEAEFYGMEGPNRVVEHIDMPTPGAFVEEEARRRDLAGVQATDIGGPSTEDNPGFADVFFQALGGRV